MNTQSVSRALLMLFSLSTAILFIACGGPKGKNGDLNSNGLNAPPSDLSSEDLSVLSQTLAAQMSSSMQPTAGIQSFSAITPLQTSPCASGSKTINQGSITYTNCLEGNVLKNGTTKLTLLGSAPTQIKTDYINYKESRQGACGTIHNTNNGSNIAKVEVNGNLNSEKITAKSTSNMNVQSLLESTKGSTLYTVLGQSTAQTQITTSGGSSKMDFSYTSNLVINGGGVKVTGVGTLESHSGCSASSPTSVVKYTIQGTKTYQLEIRHQCLTGNKIFINGVETDISCL